MPDQHTIAPHTIVVHAPSQGGTYFRDFGWTVYIDGLPALSGSERDAKSYARKMRQRFACEQQSRFMPMLSSATERRHELASERGEGEWQ